MHHTSAYAWQPQSPELLPGARQGFTPDVNGRCICDPIVSGPGCCFCAVPGTCGPVLPDAQAAAAAALVVNLHGVVLSSPGGTVFQPGQVRGRRLPRPLESGSCVERA